jgi:hypothetical protein
LGVNFNFERAPLKLQRSIKSKKKKKNSDEKEEGKIKGAALRRLWKKQKSQGQCDFLEPNKSRSERTFRPQRAQKLLIILWAA